VTQSGSQSSEAFITCSIVVAPTATPTATPAPTPTETPTPTTTPAPTQTPSPCQGSNSPELIAKTWAALGTNDANMALACAETIIANYSADADAQQAERMVVPAGKTENTCTSAVPTDGKNAGVVKEFNGKYWALDDVATAWFLRGEALMKLGKTADAITSYQAVLNKYACAYAWDPKNFWFWNVANAAKQKIPPSLLASPTATP